jgi:hypothetical protein
LDENLQLTWYWSGYDHLNVNRAAILGEEIIPNNRYAPLVLSKVKAADWLHTNCLDYIPSSGDLLMSMRSQDWVAKINYKNGTGDGTVLWALGEGGSFSINSSDPLAWFTHQHDAQYEMGGTTVLSLFDNGNTRRAQNPGTVQNSRGMVLSLDEVNMIATPILSVDLGTYSRAAGSAQRLDNGNYSFDNALIGPANDPYSEHVEITPSSTSTGGVVNYKLRGATYSYRHYRMASMYSVK